MPTFDVNTIPNFTTNIHVNYLFREDRCYAKEFRDKILQDDNLSPEFYELISIIEDVADGKMLPKTRYKLLQGCSNLQYKPSEAKTSNLRLYMIHEPGVGLILILGGKKTDQNRDIEKIKKIIREFTEFRRKQKK